MIFNLNEFLRSVSNVLDIIEMNLFGISTNHSKRIAFVAVMMAYECKLTKEEVFDLASLAIMHDNGASMKILNDKLAGSAREKFGIMENRREHCVIGENNLCSFPFMTGPENVIKYHHEKFDGSGFFGLGAEDIPFMSRLIALPDTLDIRYDLSKKTARAAMIAYVAENRGKDFAPELADVFLKLAAQDSFWVALADENIDSSLMRIIPKFEFDINYSGIRQMTKTFSNIIDAHSAFTQKHSSGLSRKIGKMAKFYHMDKVSTFQLLIAADLHDLGKLVISSDILDKPGKLTREEYQEIKRHPYIARICLQDISGFELISQWVGNHHEKLDGSGYPSGLTASDLDFQSRLLACLDIYQALREKRPYRKPMNHRDAMYILNGMARNGQIDPAIVRDIDTVFSQTRG